MNQKRTMRKQPHNEPTAATRHPSRGRSRRHSAIRSPQSAIRNAGAYTLIEIMVVVVIIAILMGITIPAVSAIWGQRKEAESESLVTGLLSTTRAAALNDKERGLFFMLDGDEQKVFRIEAAAYDPTGYPNVDPGGNPLKDRNADDFDMGLNSGATANRFVISGVMLDPAQALPNFKVETLPAPYRVAPRAVVDSTVWDATEISRRDYSLSGITQLERHRNFFAVIFSPDGRLVSGRDVLIYDPDYDGDPAGLGDRTGLAVGDATTTNWYDGTGAPAFVPGPVPNLLVDRGSTALNFRGVDGLLVYNDAEFAEQPDNAARRQYLLDQSQPLFVSPLSGQVLRGPRGENE
ncbi:MAG: prepilin-type N-terminal cleavage/methylation domain-containing protein [bacterium]|nr:prepilin-type N-terminal cleavage/methylation domain-containing protein [bacterium]